MIWELAKPVICQIQGYCLAGNLPACVTRIVAEDARVGYPPVRAMGTMDMMWAPWYMPMAKAHEFAYTGDWFSGETWSATAGPTTASQRELEEFTINFARRMGHIDNDQLNYNKRAVKRQYEIMGMRTEMMVGTDVEAMSKHRPAAGEFGKRVREGGLKRRSSGATVRSRTSVARVIPRQNSVRLRARAPTAKDRVKTVTARPDRV